MEMHMNEVKWTRGLLLLRRLQLAADRYPTAHAPLTWLVTSDTGTSRAKADSLLVAAVRTSGSLSLQQGSSATVFQTLLLHTQITRSTGWEMCLPPATASLSHLSSCR